MIYSATEDFIKITETSGTIQNSSFIFDVELSHKPEVDSGILLRPLNKFSFSDQTIYIRAIGGRADCRVIPFLVDAGAGGSSTGSISGFDSFDQDDVDDMFKP